MGKYSPSNDESQAADPNAVDPGLEQDPNAGEGTEIPLAGNGIPEPVFHEADLNAPGGNADAPQEAGDGARSPQEILDDPDTSDEDRAVTQASLEGVAAQEAIAADQASAERVSEPDDVVTHANIADVGSTERLAGDYTDGEYTVNKIVRPNDMVEGRRSVTAWNVSVALDVQPNTDEWGVEIIEALNAKQEEWEQRPTKFLTRDQARRLELSYLD